MELTYYSYYPYKDPEYRIVEDEDRGDLCAQPFRLYKAAVCKALDEFSSEEEFIQACFEAMDRPDARIKNYEKGKSYKDTEYGVEVIPTEHFYGATNDYDGVYFISHKHSWKVLPPTVYVKIITGWKKADNWHHAVTVVYRHHSSDYTTKLVDFTKDRGGACGDAAKRCPSRRKLNTWVYVRL